MAFSQRREFADSRSPGAHNSTERLAMRAMHPAPRGLPTINSINLNMQLTQQLGAEKISVKTIKQAVK